MGEDGVESHRCHDEGDKRKAEENDGQQRDEPLLMGDGVAEIGTLRKGRSGSRLATAGAGCIQLMLDSTSNDIEPQPSC